MEKTSKVTQISGAGHYDGQYGRMYRFEIHFENGDYGQYMSKSQDQTKFVMGQNATYTRESKEHNGNTYYTIKPAQTSTFSGGGGGGGFKKDPETEKRISRMSVLKVAGDLCIAGKIELHSITNVAQILERYVMTGDDSMTAIYHQNSNKPKARPSGNIEQSFQEEAIKQMVDEDNDLPF
jgi:hypothetical protein